MAAFYTKTINILFCLDKLNTIQSYAPMLFT